MQKVIPPDKESIGAGQFGVLVAELELAKRMAEEGDYASFDPHVFEPDAFR